MRNKTNPSGAEKKRPSKILVPLIVVAAVVLLLALYSFLPPSAYFRVSNETDDSGISMLQNTQGMLYRQNPISDWKPFGDTAYVGVGGKYYLYSYQNDPEQTFLHGVEYVWADSMVEYYRDGFSFPELIPENVGSITPVVFERSDYGEALEQATYDSASALPPVTDPVVIAEVFALLQNKALYTDIPQEGWYELGELVCACKQYSFLAYTVPVIRVEDQVYLVVYETDAETGQRTAYGVAVPGETLRRLGPWGE